MFRKLELLLEPTGSADSYFVDKKYVIKLIYIPNSSNYFCFVKKIVKITGIYTEGEMLFSAIKKKYPCPFYSILLNIRYSKSI